MCSVHGKEELSQVPCSSFRRYVVVVPHDDVNTEVIVREQGGGGTRMRQALTVTNSLVLPQRTQKLESSKINLVR